MLRTFWHHLALWLGIYIVYTYMMAYDDDLWACMLTNLVNVPLYMIAYYLLKHVQIPYLYNKQRMPWFILSFLISSISLSIICRLNGYWWMDELNGKEGHIPLLTLGAYLLKTVRFYSPAMAILAWESQYQHRQEKERVELLEKEKLSTELKFLKAQINPHFLFNTLNNLYAYVVTQSPKAPDMIMRLSGILDYVLYRSQQLNVALSEEVKTIENFLGLEQIRYGDRLRVDYEARGNHNLSISPLILLSLVENAFKHGASGDVDEPHISIRISTHEDTINCKVWNTKSVHKGEFNDAYKEGIGLSNIKRQLKLSYPDRHELRIDDQADSFAVYISLKPAYEPHPLPID